MLKATIALGLAAALLSGCAQAPEKPSVDEMKQQIAAREEAWNAAFASRDAGAIADFYAEDGTLALPGQQIVRGQGPLREALTEIAGDENFKISFRANRVDVAESGDLAFSRGQYLMTTTNAQTNTPETNRGYYLTVWTKTEDGEWKAIEDFITPGPAPEVSQRAVMVQGI